MANLFDPISLRGLTLPNRVIVSPMCQYSAQDGNANEWHIAHLSSLALGGVGMLCLEATAVTAKGRISPNCLGLWSEENETAMAHLLAILRSVSPVKIAIQLSHAGRKASSAPPWQGGQLVDPDKGGWQPVAPSPVPHKADEPAPTELGIDDLAAIRDAFVGAARRAVRLGFDAIELHGAHGYLLHQFLSPIANKRSDKYGGSLENRLRFPLEVFDAVRAAVPESMPVGVRLSGTDWVEDESSWTIEQTIELGLRLEKSGVDWLDLSSGGVSPHQKIPVGPGYQVHLAEAVRRQVKVPVMAVGLITEPTQAQEIVASGRADMVALGRALLYNPRWAWHAASELGAQLPAPPQYWRSLPTGKNAIFTNTSFGMR